MKLFILNFVCQVGFIYLRTINISSVAKDNLSLSVLSGSVLSLLYIYTTTLGVNAFNNNDIPSVIAYLTGGITGLIIAMRSNQIKKSISETIFSVKNNGKHQ